MSEPTDPAPGGAAASPARAIAFGLLVAIGGAAAITVLGGMLAISAGLLVVAALIGWLVPATMRAAADGDPAGGGESAEGTRAAGGTSAAALARSARTMVAVALAVGSVVLGQLGLWLYARVEGGVLPLGGYLAETFGVLVPFQVAVAAIVAWRAAR